MPKYRTIVADPPWPIHDHGLRTKAERGRWPVSAGFKVPYPVMPIAEITALPIGELADEQAHLYLWTTNEFVERSWDMVREWGFKPSTLLTWCKTPRGLGFGGAYCISTEFVLFARRGKLAPLQREDSTWWNWTRPETGTGPRHSRKPEAFLDMVERVSPPPRLELFARRNRLGWDTWGNEALEMVQL